MNNIFKLVSNYFRMFFAKIFKNSKRKLATYTIAIIVLIVGLVFSFIFTLLSYYNISNAIKLEVPEIAIYSFATTMIMFAFVLIITESGNNSSNENAVIGNKNNLKSSDLYNTENTDKALDTTKKPQTTISHSSNQNTTEKSNLPPKASEQYGEWGTPVKN